MSRLADAGAGIGLGVVFHADSRSPGSRTGFALTPYCTELNRRYRFRLEVHGQRAELSCDGHVVSRRPRKTSSRPNGRGSFTILPRAAGGEERLPLGEGTFANTGEYRNGCSLLPSSGVAVLRQAAGDFTQAPESTAVSLSYGPYGGGHGHRDKLNIVLYALGRQWLPDFPSMPYESHWKREWTAKPSVTTPVVVDGISKRPRGTSHLYFPVDHASIRCWVKLDRFYPQGNFAARGADRLSPRARRCALCCGSAAIALSTCSTSS